MVRNHMRRWATNKHQSNPHSAAELASIFRDSQMFDTGTLRRSQIPPDTGHLSRHALLHLMDNTDQIEISETRLERVRTYDDMQAADTKAPVLMVRSYPPFLLNSSPSGQRASWPDVESLLSQKQRQELVKVFFHFVQPAFPILHHSGEAESDHPDSFALGTTSLALSACVYATALPFSIHNDDLNSTLTDPSGKRETFYAMAIAALLEEANNPSIETLQACLLLIQKGPTIQHQGLTPTYSWLASLAVTMANALGLQHDCSDWTIPDVEKHFRHRLWYATFSVDFWVGIDTPGGRSICSQNYDVPLPKLSNGLTDSETDSRRYSHFDCLVSLTLLLSQIHDTYYTLRAAKETATDLFQSLELAKPLRSALNEGKQTLRSEIPMSANGKPGASGSVHLAGCVGSIILFRALLRPIQAGSSRKALAGDGEVSAAAAAIMTGSINCAREAVELLEHMVSMVGPWNEFWHSWSQGNFAIVSTFLVQLMLMSAGENSTKTEVMDLISRWKRAIRVGAGSGGWGSSLLSMALSRLDSLLSHAAV